MIGWRRPVAKTSGVGSIIRSMGWTSPEAHDLFRLFAKYDAERRQRERLLVSENLQVVPTTQQVRDELAALGPEDVEVALRQHPGYSADRKIESVSTMLDLFRRALIDLNRAIELFPDLGSPDGRPDRELLEHDVSILVNKELFAALGAAKALVDYSRRIKGLVDADQFELRKNQAFSPQEHALIMDLRNSVLHRVHSEANWQKVYRGGPPTTHFVIGREELLAEGELGAAAREHLASLGAKIDVTDLLSSYSEKVETFYAWLLPEVEAKLPLEVADYRACRQEMKRQHGRLSYGFLIKTWMNAGINPYEHLHKHLTADQLKKVEQLPHRSEDQVDFIIGCVDRHDVCDETLRKIVYEFFRVGE
jgi:hypothetical protein